jgi:hypothetical protein
LSKWTGVYSTVRRIVRWAMIGVGKRKRRKVRREEKVKVRE